MRTDGLYTLLSSPSTPGSSRSSRLMPTYLFLTQATRLASFEEVKCFRKSKRSTAGGTGCLDILENLPLPRRRRCGPCTFTTARLGEGTLQLVGSGLGVVGVNAALAWPYVPAVSRSGRRTQRRHRSYIVPGSIYPLLEPGAGAG